MLNFIIKNCSIEIIENIILFILQFPYIFLCLNLNPFVDLSTCPGVTDLQLRIYAIKECLHGNMKKISKTICRIIVYGILKRFPP